MELRPPWQIFDLNLATGNVVGLGPATNLALPAPYGWENGVDPIAFAIAGVQIVVAPMEAESGGAARVVVMQVANNGVVGAQVTIDLGDLGFEDGLDPVLINYGDQGVMIPLETESGSAAGILAINVNPGGGIFGRCTVVASDIRNTGCELDLNDPRTDRIRRLAGRRGRALGDRARFAIPIAREDGSDSDLAFIDWDFSTPFPAPPPVYLGFQSVKSINSPNPRSLPFPGFEREVDIALVNLCGWEFRIRFWSPSRIASPAAGSVPGQRRHWGRGLEVRLRQSARFPAHPRLRGSGRPRSLVKHGRTPR